MKKIVLLSLAILCSFNFYAQSIPEALDEMKTIIKEINGTQVDQLKKLKKELSQFSRNSSNRKKRQGATRVKNTTLSLIQNMNVSYYKAKRLEKFFTSHNMRRTTDFAEIYITGFGSMIYAAKYLVEQCNSLIKRPKNHRDVRKTYNTIVTKLREMKSDYDNYDN